MCSFGLEYSTTEDAMPVYKCIQLESLAPRLLLAKSCYTVTCRLIFLIRKKAHLNMIDPEKNTVEQVNEKKGITFIIIIFFFFWKHQ